MQTLDAPKVVKMITFSVASDEHLIKNDIPNPMLCKKTVDPKWGIILSVWNACP